MAITGEPPWKRFTEQVFTEKLWALFAEHLDARLGVDAEWRYHGLDDRGLVLAVVRVLMWARLRPMFERLVWAQLALPEISGVSLRKWHNLSELAEKGSFLLGFAYSQLSLKGDHWNRVALEKLVATVENRFELSEQTRPRKWPPIPWHCWTALAAIQYLRSRIVPTRKQVIQGAIECRALFELLDDCFNPKCFRSRISELKNEVPGNWARVFRELELVGLPRTEQQY
jgi:hypothetical protein